MLEVLAISACGIPAILFCVLYTRYANWWLTPTGRHLFFLTLGIAAFAGVSIVNRTIGNDWPGYDAVITVIYALLAYQLWRRVHLLWSNNHRRSQRKVDPS